MEKRVVVIVGPTCSGKTSLAIELAKKIKTEILSADSRQIYKHLTIGTAKPSAEELSAAKHHFINEIEPNAEYNVSRFETEALEKISGLHKKNKIPIVAGGSGLYIKALVDGLFNTVDADDEYREELLEIRKKDGNEKLYEMLVSVDLESSKSMLPQNWKRVMRALEVFHLTGKPISQLQKDYKRESDLEFLQFGLSWNREILYQNIEKRVDRMMEEGLVKETEKLLAKGFSPEINSLNTVGYKEIIQFLNKVISLERAVELIKRNTRRYAKRQMTWFRKDKRIKWYDIDSSIELKEIADRICSNL